MNNAFNFKSFVTAMVKHVVWLVMIPLVCASIMFAISSLEDSTYTATVDFLSKNNTNAVDYNAATFQNAKKTEIENYSKILTSDAVLKPVSEQLSSKHGMSVSISEIRAMISISVPDGTSVMSVVVTAGSQELAEKICQSLSEIFIPIIENSYEKQNILECISREYKAVENKPDLLNSTLVGAAIGFIVTFAVCFFLAYNDKTVRTVEEAKKLLEIPVIGVIPR